MSFTRRACVFGLLAILGACAPNPNAGGVADFGSVVGTIVDAKSQQPLTSAAIQIGIQVVRISAADKGQFRVDNVPVGTQSATISSPGYQTYTLDGIVVHKNETTVIPNPIGLVSTTGL